MVNHTARIEAHELQIQQLQSDVTEIKTILQSLVASQAENNDFQKTVMAWMKQQEKGPSEGFSGSASGSAEVLNSSGSKIDSSGDTPLIPWAVSKVKLPEFSGFDPQGWIQKANLFFDLNQTPDASRLKLVQLSMIGVAQHWFTIITQVRPSLTWTDFQPELLLRFSGLAVQNPYEQLASIRQSDSLLDYIDDFEYVLSLVPSLPESQTLGYFIAGLKDDVKQRVRLHRPTTCIDAMSLARDVELMLRPSDFSTLSSRFRYSSHLGLPLLDNGVVHRSLGNSVSKSVGQVSYHDHGVRSLSRTEWEERRKKGLCYKCGQLYSPTHRCPEGKLRVLLLGDDELEESDGSHFQLGHRGNVYSDGVLQTALGSLKP